MKIAIVYYSNSGNTKKIAEIIGEGVKTVSSDIEIRLMGIDEIDYKFLEESKTVIFGTPTYYANMSWQLKKWIDESAKCNLGGKIGAVFATENLLGGGADTALLTLIGQLMVKGMLVYSGGSSLGQPFIHMGIVAIKDGDNEQKDRARIFGERVAQKTIELFSK